MRPAAETGWAWLPFQLAGVLCCVGSVALFWPFAATAAGAAVAVGAPGADIRYVATPEVEQTISWVRATGDHRGQAFAIIDKKAAMLHVFDTAGRLRGSSPVLLGLAVGDDSVPGIGERKMSEIRPDERTTPAGRFASEPGRNLQNDDIVWIDYNAAVSMHRVRSGSKGDRRLERLATRTPADNRISYGCVNVPAPFYDALIKPVFGATSAVVYVLPETRPLSDFFGRSSAAALTSGK